jgi:hypothetical protein
VKGTFKSNEKASHFYLYAWQRNTELSREAKLRFIFTSELRD